MLHCKHVERHRGERLGKFDARLTVKNLICERLGGILVSALDFEIWPGRFVVF